MSIEIKYVLLEAGYSYMIINWYVNMSKHGHLAMWGVLVELKVSTLTWRTKHQEWWYYEEIPVNQR